MDQSLLFASIVAYKNQSYQVLKSIYISIERKRYLPFQK